LIIIYNQLDGSSRVLQTIASGDRTRAAHMSKAASKSSPRKTAAKADPALKIRRDGAVAIIELNRPQKRNALADDMVHALGNYLDALPADVGAILLTGAGEHFCAGLDLSMLRERSAAEGAMHSRMWHGVFDKLQFGRVPVVAVLHGAVIGGGLELAAAAHVRVAEPSAFYALPEGQRGIFVGGGGSVRVPRLIGVARMTDMMLTGRVYRAEEGERVGLAQYLVGAGEGMARGLELARKMAGNAPMTNFAVMHALPRIADATHAQGLFTEALIAGIAQSEPEAKARMQQFLQGKAKKVGS
jgi:enoyl-CoA hydratase/carnithine racemase